ncbi:beta-N-acetylhexosaminidase [Paenibacillus mendelii]|uniref:Beta-N-acetylhexosaminidase n=1 Tax=Paenibacillus mendelii TaxID=206163 RepID=A0ABV6J4W9_9BACL|nr:beta-N-acetylhexosaminidase [Paenibacillus mendelii]MCQ6560474.1 beta-N-acetylhexosaminidase [Paenibacillus mendelii]
MNLHFILEDSDLEPGIRIFAEEFHFSVKDEGMPIQVTQKNENIIVVSKSGDKAWIQYEHKHQFFRALGLLLEHMQDKQEFYMTEVPQFSTNGPMIDVSQGNAVLQAETLRRLMTKMAAMGLNMLMLYTEDSYEVQEQPYFGYMRGRYSQDEIRQCDDYANLFGIELIPCIQTLSHLREVIKWDCFADIKDDGDTLLVGEEKTYAFIEQMIIAATSPVRTKRIHIGMDEAMKLGQGNYLLKNGLRSKFEIMNEHLTRVLQITEKHGLKPMIWSDMYFRAGSDVGDNYDRNMILPDNISEVMPPNLQYIFWDYYHFDEAFYLDFIRKHKQFGSTPIFAGGIWNWKGFCLNYGATFASTEAALAACKREGVKEIIATLWGDDGSECHIYSALLGLQLFAEHGYAQQVDEPKLKRRFEFCTGGRYEDFMDIRLVDEIPGTFEGNREMVNPSRYLLWQQVLMGLFDHNIDGLPLDEHYAKLAIQYEQAMRRNGQWGQVFGVLHKLCRVLSVKSEIGLRITRAYKNGDKASLLDFAQRELVDLIGRVEELREYHLSQWHQLYKPFGWEVIDFRYGGLLSGLRTAIRRLDDYVFGRIRRLEELEEERLPYQGQEGIVDCYWYKGMPTASRLIQSVD